MDHEAVHERLRLVQRQEFLCRTMSSRFYDVCNSELNPLLTALKVIKNEYSLMKPEVYRTLIAVLYDYIPSCGEEHRRKIIRYIRMLLDGRPELADSIVSILPPADTNYLQDINLAAGLNNSTTKAINASKVAKQSIKNVIKPRTTKPTRETTFITNAGHFSQVSVSNPATKSTSNETVSAVTSHSYITSVSDSSPRTSIQMITSLGDVQQMTVPSPSTSRMDSTLVSGGQQTAASHIRAVVEDALHPVVAKELNSLGITVESPPNNKTPNKRILLMKPLSTSGPTVRFTANVTASEKFRPGSRLILSDNKWIGISQPSSQVALSPLMPKPLMSISSLQPTIRMSSTASIPGAPRLPIRLPPKPVVRTRMLIFNRPIAPRVVNASYAQSVQSESTTASSDTYSQMDRESPLSCIEQLVRNAGADMSKTISDVECGSDGPMSAASYGGVATLMRRNRSPSPLDLSFKWSDSVEQVVVDAVKPRTSVGLTVACNNCDESKNRDGNETGRMLTFNDATSDYNESSEPAISTTSLQTTDSDVDASHVGGEEEMWWCETLNLKRKTCEGNGCKRFKSKE